MSSARLWRTLCLMALTYQLGAATRYACSCTLRPTSTQPVGLSVQLHPEAHQHSTCGLQRAAAREAHRGCVLSALLCPAFADSSPVDRRVKEPLWNYTLGDGWTQMQKAVVTSTTFLEVKGDVVFQTTLELSLFMCPPVCGGL
ncbi:unnamed protein product [Boreogadus saida]